ncbi:MAG: hypothetical protein NTZ68_00020 [Candidatus Dependentiae bacterium]|nr:hypothetical protein [Candidatus Dependentiae bacterium]
MLKKITPHVSKWFYSFLELQLVISLMSLPLLTHWGLPVSYMSPVANLIFTPLLILFLWVSCLFSVFALVRLPCSWFVYLLDKITDLWHFMLSFANPEWLMGFCYQTLWISLFFCFLVFILYTYIKPTTKQAVCTLLIFWLILIGVRYSMQKNLCQKVGNLPLCALRINGKVYLIDDGALCSKQNFYSNIDYTILPELIKTTGITSIDTLVLCKPSKRLAKIAHQFAMQTNVQTIMVTTKAKGFKEMSDMFQDSSVNVLPLTPKKKIKFPATKKAKKKALTPSQSPF